MSDDEYEWKAVSDFVVVKDGVGQAIVPWSEGWENVGGALRRKKRCKICGGHHGQCGGPCT